MKALEFLLLAFIAILFVNCNSASSKGLLSSNSIYRQPKIKTYSVNSIGLHDTNQKGLWSK